MMMMVTVEGRHKEQKKVERRRKEDTIVKRRRGEVLCVLVGLVCVKSMCLIGVFVSLF